MKNTVVSLFYISFRITVRIFFHFQFLNKCIKRRPKRKKKNLQLNFPQFKFRQNRETIYSYIFFILFLIVPRFNSPANEVNKERIPFHQHFITASWNFTPYSTKEKLYIFHRVDTEFPLRRGSRSRKLALFFSYGGVILAIIFYGDNGTDVRCT